MGHGHYPGSIYTVEVTLGLGLIFEAINIFQGNYFFPLLAQ